MTDAERVNVKPFFVRDPITCPRWWRLRFPRWWRVVNGSFQVSYNGVDWLAA